MQPYISNVQKPLLLEYLQLLHIKSVAIAIDNSLASISRNDKVPVRAGVGSTRLRLGRRPGRWAGGRGDVPRGDGPSSRVGLAVARI